MTNPPILTYQKKSLTQLFLISVVLNLTGCVGPPALQQAVIGYDRTTAKLDQQLLLLNIARLNDALPVHFTKTSSIAATFDWRTSLSGGGDIGLNGTNSGINFDLSGSSAENPTFSIIPISGENFTKHILTPLDEALLNFSMFQGLRIDQSLRLMAQGIEIQNSNGSFSRTIANNPAKPKEYDEFRRITMHLEWLAENQQLFVRRLVFEQTLFDNFTGTLASKDVREGFEKGFKWQQNEDGSYKFSRFTVGRVVVTNYDPLAMTDFQRYQLNEKIKRNPNSFVYLDIRSDGPGGNFPVQGAIKLRSMIQVIGFIASGIEASPEFNVKKDPRTGKIPFSPTDTLKINVTDSDQALADGVPVTQYDGKYYSIADTEWDRNSFMIISYLFQQAVGKVEDVGIPITIAK